MRPTDGERYDIAREVTRRWKHNLNDFLVFISLLLFLFRRGALYRIASMFTTAKARGERLGIDREVDGTMVGISRRAEWGQTIFDSSTSVVSGALAAQRTRVGEHREQKRSQRDQPAACFPDPVAIDTAATTELPIDWMW